MEINTNEDIELIQDIFNSKYKDAKVQCSLEGDNSMIYFEGKLAGLFRTPNYRYYVEIKECEHDKTNVILKLAKNMPFMLEDYTVEVVAGEKVFNFDLPLGYGDTPNVKISIVP